MLVSKRLTKLRVPGFNTTHFSSSLCHFIPSTLPQLQNPSDSTFLFSTSSSSGVGLNISPASDKLRPPVHLIEDDEAHGCLKLKKSHGNFRDRLCFVITTGCF